MNDQMDAGRTDRCAAWLANLERWSGASVTAKRVAVACEVVRGIVDVDDPAQPARRSGAGPMTPEERKADRQARYRAADAAYTSDDPAFAAVVATLEAERDAEPNPAGDAADEIERLLGEAE